MTAVVVVTNQKGGVGKTTTTVSLAHGLALLYGLKVLALDLDTQGHLAVGLGLERTPGLHGLIVQGKHPDEVIVSARPGLDIIPGDRTTEEVKRYVMMMHLRREFVLRDRLAPVLARYDALLIDCAPSSDILHTAAFAVADWMLVPARLSGLDLDGVVQVLAMARTVRESVPSCRLAFAGVLPTFYERQTNETTNQLRALIERFGNHVWPVIPQDIRAREAPSYRRTLWEYAPGSAAIAGYTSPNGNGGSVGGDHMCRPYSPRNGIRRIGGYRWATERLWRLIQGRGEGNGAEKAGT